MKQAAGNQIVSIFLHISLRPYLVLYLSTWNASLESALKSGLNFRINFPWKKKNPSLLLFSLFRGNPKSMYQWYKNFRLVGSTATDDLQMEKVQVPFACTTNLSDKAFFTFLPHQNNRFINTFSLLFCSVEQISLCDICQVAKSNQLNKIWHRLILFAFLQGVSLLGLYSLSSYFFWHSDSFQSLSKEKLMQSGGNSRYSYALITLLQCTYRPTKGWLNSHLQEMFWNVPVYWRITTYLLIPEAIQNMLQTTYYPATECGHRLSGNLLQKGMYVFGFQCLSADFIILLLDCWTRTSSLTEREQCGFLTMSYNSANEQVEATLDPSKGCFAPTQIKIIIP